MVKVQLIGLISKRGSPCGFEAYPNWSSSDELGFGNSVAASYKCDPRCFRGCLAASSRMGCIS
jgi:hypothetical protein